MTLSLKMTMNDYLKDNQFESNEFRYRYLTILMAFNKISKSTPFRMLQCPNRQAVCRSESTIKIDKNMVGVKDVKSSPEQNHNLSDNLSPLNESNNQKPKLLSYNDTIKYYNLSLLTPHKITINHLLTISPIFADISDAF